MSECSKGCPKCDMCEAIIEDYDDLTDDYVKLVDFARRVSNDSVHYYGLMAENLLKDIGESDE